MPDFGAPVADQITSPNPNQTIQTLSGLVGLAQQQQNLQTGQYAQQQQQSSAQQSQQQMSERQLLQQTLLTGKDPDGNSIKGADGQPDPVAMSQFAGKYLPLTGQDVTQHIIATQQNKLQLNDGVRTLGQNYRNDISGIIGAGIGASDPSVISNGLDAYAQQNPQAAGVIANAKTMLQGISPSTPQPQRDMALKHVQMLMQPAATTAQQQQPQIGTTTGPGGGVQAIQTNPLSAVPMGAVGPETAQGIPLGERSQVGTNALTGGPTVINKNGQGQVTGITNAPTQGVYVPQPGDAQALPVLQGERDAARQQFTNAGVQHQNNQLVLQNIDNVAATGPLGQKARNALSLFGVNSNSDSATAYDLVGKGLERSALQAAQAMGPNTNAGLEAQVKANGSLGYTPQAIKEVTKLNDALTSGVQAYQPGLERAVSSNPSAGVFAKRQFDEAWGANFDPNIFKYYNAIKSGDSTEQQAIVKQLGGLNSKGYNAMMQKARNLQQLSNTGSLQ